MLTKKNYAHPPQPCTECPFRRAGGIRLLVPRIAEILSHVAPEDGRGGSFPCHKTVDHDARDQRKELMCAGALIFAYKVERSTQMMRICERLGVIDRALADGAHPEIFADEDEMYAAALPERGRRTPTRRRG